jgi:antirestriction protein ArdC
MKNNIYKQITRQIIENLDKAGSWQKLWDVPQPVSLNGHQYRGINHLLLSTSNYSSPVWGTYLQVRQNGGTVNKGEKSSLVVFWKKLLREKENPETGETEPESSLMLRYYQVFNSEQCTFDEIAIEKIKKLSRVSGSLQRERFTPAEEIITGMPDRPKISLGSYQTPCYIPVLDEVRMPRLEYFFNSREYYSAFFHELVHSTGHRKRLNRFETDQFDGRKAYSREELVAELGAAYLATIAGIKPDMENTTAYIKGWLKVLDSYPSWILWAASRAQKACEHIVPVVVPSEVEI